MEASIAVAIITAIGGLLVSAISLVSSKEAIREAAKAKENSKRSEQLRGQALDVGKKILEAFYPVLLNCERIEFALSTRSNKALTPEETKALFEPIGSGIVEVKRLLNLNAIYIDPVIYARFSDLVKPIFQGKIEFNVWENFANRLRDQHSIIANTFRDMYLMDRRE